jgi:ubiquinone/menaquinone biosynthesis C-methylase UbiE
MIGEQRTKVFYDRYWPANVPDHRRTREHVRAIVPPRRYRRALDGGSGSGVCSVALSEMSGQVVGVDIGMACARLSSELIQATGTTNAAFSQASLLRLPFPSGSFDLVFSWGVIHHTVDPIRALDELVRVLGGGGTLVLAVYLKTALTPVHELIRHICLRLPHMLRRPLIHSVAGAVRAAEALGRTNNPRNDNANIAAQVEDWYFVPEKHFFSVEQMRRLFNERGLTFEVVYPQTGRFRSSSNFVVRGERAR